MRAPTHAPCACRAARSASPPPRRRKTGRSTVPWASPARSAPPAHTPRPPSARMWRALIGALRVQCGRRALWRATPPMAAAAAAMRATATTPRPPFGCAGTMWTTRTATSKARTAARAPSSSGARAPRRCPRHTRSTCFLTSAIPARRVPVSTPGTPAQPRASDAALRRDPSSAAAGHPLWSLGIAHGLAHAVAPGRLERQEGRGGAGSVALARRPGRDSGASPLRCLPAAERNGAQLAAR